MQKVYAPTVADMGEAAVVDEATAMSDSTKEGVAPEQAQDSDTEKAQPQTDAGVKKTEDTDTVATIDANSSKDTSLDAAPKKSKSSLKLNIRNKLVSFGFSVPNKPRTIDTIILHSSYD
ncbi:MAG: hypothetical protein PHT88_05790, partial [Candidatus Moranbacteria bacterium]|nr:hypothetical protein [Candidatus Moranbacteria bacterium]